MSRTYSHTKYCRLTATRRVHGKIRNSPVRLFASSANSFTYILRNTGDDSAPCGTPLVMAAHRSVGSPCVQKSMILFCTRGDRSKCGACHCLGMLMISLCCYSTIVPTSKCRSTLSQPIPRLSTATCCIPCCALDCTFRIACSTDMPAWKLICVLAIVKRPQT